MSEENLEAALVTYNTQRDKFESVYERNKFYRGLFGYTQTVKKNGKKYEYEKDGLMDEIANVRIDDSVFIVSKESLGQLKEYFEEWGSKVSYHVFTVLLDKKDIIDQLDEDRELPE